MIDRWRGQRVIVAATGPSLTAEVAEQCRGSGLPVVAVSDAYKLFPFAAVLYSCDARWWEAHRGVPDFAGEKWTSWDAQRVKTQKPVAKQYGLHLIEGAKRDGFALSPPIHYGANSGFQAVNLAILAGASPIVLVGFNLQRVNKTLHFFGDHKHPRLTNSPDLKKFREAFTSAAKRLPPHIQILNATPDSALSCFPKVALTDAIAIAESNQQEQTQWQPIPNTNRSLNI